MTSHQDFVQRLSGVYIVVYHTHRTWFGHYFWNQSVLPSIFHIKMQYTLEFVCFYKGRNKKLIAKWKVSVSVWPIRFVYDTSKCYTMWCQAVQKSMTGHPIMTDPTLASNISTIQEPLHSQPRWQHLALASSSTSIRSGQFQLEYSCRHVSQKVFFRLWGRINFVYSSQRRNHKTTTDMVTGQNETLSNVFYLFTTLYGGLVSHQIYL